jgi:hypothetical protein
MSTNTEEVETEAEAEDSPNISRLREMALRGDDYRSMIEFTYYDMEGELYVRPLNDLEFLPIAAKLEDRLDMDTDEAKAALEDGKDEAEETIDPSQFDKAFVKIMHEAAEIGIDTTQGLAEGEDEEGVGEIVAMLQGGKSLIIAERVLEISSDADKAQTFRRDGGGE